MTKSITVAYGDGIGPEIMEATLEIMDSAGADIETEVIEIGQKVYERGIDCGIEESSWESLKRTNCFLKAPITTPQGGGFKSLNVTIRKTLGMFANVRPCVSYAPFVKTTQSDMDLIIVRENEEDLYAGVEHQQTDNVVQCLKLISRTGSERIIRYAFEYARVNNRKKVTCISKDNIMKMTDGLFHAIFDEIALGYPDIENNHIIVDIGSAKMASDPSMFDVIVTENLYGDIISDIAAEVSGSVGLAGSYNIGKYGAMFEAIHGSAPDIAGQGIANPSGLLHGSILMLQHIGQSEVAQNMHNAWLKTLEDGIHTGDVYSEEHSKHKVNTKEFTQAVIERLGSVPMTLKSVDYASSERKRVRIDTVSLPIASKKELIGTDIFVHWRGREDIEVFANSIINKKVEGLELETITQRGLMVWPSSNSPKVESDHWCCRFKSVNDEKISPNLIIKQLQTFQEQGIEFIKIENLYNINGKRSFSVAQGQ